MSHPVEFSKTGRIVILAIIVACIVGVGLSLLNQPGGPVAETTGIIKAFGYVPTDVGPPPRIVTVRLSDGATVQASVLTNVMVQPGNLAKVRVYRRALSGSPMYEIVATEAKK